MIYFYDNHIRIIVNNCINSYGIHILQYNQYINISIYPTIPEHVSSPPDFLTRRTAPRSTCWRHAALILGRIVDDMKPDLTAFNIDISGCQGLQWLQGFSRLSRLKQIGLGPTAVTYGEFLKACLKSEDDRRGVTKSINTTVDNGKFGRFSHSYGQKGSKRYTIINYFRGISTFRFLFWGCYTLW